MCGLLSFQMIGCADKQGSPKATTTASNAAASTPAKNNIQPAAPVETVKPEDWHNPSMDDAAP